MDAVAAARMTVLGIIGVGVVLALVLAVAVSIIECAGVDSKATRYAWKVVLPFAAGGLFMWVVALLCDAALYSFLDSL